MGFIVCPTSRVVFRVEIKQVSVRVFNHFDYKEVYFTGNFDNYKTINGPSVEMSHSGTASFSEFKSLFVYETSAMDIVDDPEVLVTKIVSFDVFADSEVFLGTAIVDLLTLATGPKQVSLSFYNGDALGGRFNFEIDMADMSESVCMLQEITVSQEAGSTPVDWERLQLQIVRGDKDGVEDVLPAGKAIIDPQDPTTVRFRPRKSHNYPMTLLDLYTKASFSFRFEIVEGCCSFNRKIGQATAMLGDGIKDLDPEQQYRKKKPYPADGSEPPDDIKNPLPRNEQEKRRLSMAQAPPQPGHVEINPLPHFSGIAGVDNGIGRFEKVVDFHETTGGGEDNEGERLLVKGRIYISRIPRFAQMQSGMTVDGVVCNGVAVPGNHPAPPFTDHGDATDV